MKIADEIETTEDKNRAVVEAESLDKVAERISELIEKIVDPAKPRSAVFMLTEQMVLTVKKPDGNYSKRAHIGGEEFIPLKAYAGKRGKLIYIFRPAYVAEYMAMEMDEDQARRSLTGFDEWVDENIHHELERELRAAQERKARDDERARLATREKDYADQGFGSWS